jgi:anti-sigma factor RsiW
MLAEHTSCEVIVPLMGAWSDGLLDADDRDAFEQHLLLCPPCLARGEADRWARQAVRAAAAVVPDAAVVARILRNEP